MKHKARILAAIEHNLSNGLIESTNTKIRLITRIAFGFKSPEALIALALLSPGGHRAALGKKLTHECVRRALKTQDQLRSLMHQAGLADGRGVGIDQGRCSCIASRYRLSMFGEAA